MGDEGCAFTKDTFYCGDEKKQHISDYGSDKMNVILRYLKQTNIFGGYSDAVVVTLENIKGCTNWFIRTSNSSANKT